MFTALRILWACYGPKFLRDKRGTPSIETVLIIALIALAVAPMLDDLGLTIGNVFNALSTSLESNTTSAGG